MILIDTSPLVALCDARDEKHRVAVRHLESLISSEFTLCEAVLAETCFTCLTGAGSCVCALLNDLHVQPVPGANGCDFRVQVFDLADQVIRTRSPDWADGCLAVLSGRYRDAKVWTYDREFRTAWRLPDEDSNVRNLLHAGITLWWRSMFCLRHLLPECGDVCQELSDGYNPGICKLPQSQKVLVLRNDEVRSGFECTFQHMVVLGIFLEDKELHSRRDVVRDGQELVAGTL